MAKNVFRKNMDYEPKLTRSSKDLSFDNNFTTKFGQITPLMWKFLNAGESISIDTNFAIQFKPTVFPVQTPIRATMHFFKVPIRLLYKDWEDFRYGNKTDLVLPYHRLSSDDAMKSMFRSCGLMDYLGVPSTYYGDGDYAITYLPDNGNTLLTQNRVMTFVDGTGHTLTDYHLIVNYYNTHNQSIVGRSNPFDPFFYTIQYTDGILQPADTSQAVNTFTVGTPFVINNKLRQFLPFRGIGFEYHNTSSIHFYGLFLCVMNAGKVVSSQILDFDHSTFYDTSSSNGSLYLKAVNDLVNNNPDCDLFIYPYRFTTQEANFNNFGRYGFVMSVSDGVDWVDLPNARRVLDELSPSALPARAYEMIYNAFFRSNQNVDPFMIDGVVEPNKYLPTTDGGPDDIFYELHFRNWDDDFLTTAYKTPQQGPAPLVGITSVNANSLGSLNGVMQVDRGDGTTAEIGVKLDENAKVVSLSNDDLAPESTQVRLEAIRAVTQGISINDFRDVSAYQVWLERNIRRGLKFVDQQLAHTGVKIKNRELDMPEFIGGYSRMIQVSKVNDTTSEGLGDYAGQLSLFDGSRHNITSFADQPCIVMGLMTIIPQASYSQLMPKFFSRRTAGDFFDPAFNKIGLQPITYREVCPVQAFLEGKDVDSTFGYQIPWYDDQSSVDEVHGQMRQLYMRDRLINRSFAVAPELSKDFLRIDPDQVNDVFPDRNPDDDPICGQVHFTMYKKSQIYDMHVPGII